MLHFLTKMFPYGNNSNTTGDEISESRKRFLIDKFKHFKIFQNFRYLKNSFYNKYTPSDGCDIIYPALKAILHLTKVPLESMYYDTSLFVKDIKAPNVVAELGTKIENDMNVSGSRYFTSHIPNYGDIVSDVIIYGSGIRKVEIKLGDQCIYRRHFLNANMVSFTPFYQGLILLNTRNNDHEYKIVIYADIIDNLSAKFVYLPNYNRKFISQGNFKFNYDFYDNGIYYNAIEYKNNEFYLKQS